MTKQLMFLALSCGIAFAVTSTPFIVTTEGPITERDLIARVNNQPAEIASWHALRDDSAGLELWIMIDDGTNTNVGTQFNDIRNFVRQQPPQVKVAIGYLRNGSVLAAQKPTVDREAAVKAIRLPYGMPGISASPYIALSEFLHKLPVAPQPREIVLISSGIDPYYPGFPPQDPYLQTAIEASQKAGVPIQTIYYASAGHAGHSYWLINSGQNDLSYLSEETGGEFYWQGNSNPVSMQPFFDDINRHIAEQYVISVEVPKGHRGFERMGLRTETPHGSPVAPSQVYLP